MPKPEVTIENHEAVYDYYAQHEPSQLALRGLHQVASQLYRPNIEYADGAKDRINKLLASDHRLVIASNHINIMDQMPCAAALSREPLRPVVGHTVTLAKQPYFRQPLLRQTMDALGAVPVFREQDIPAGANRELRIRVNQALFKSAVEKIVAGDHLFLFPEGTRNGGDPSRLGQIKSGVGHIAFQAAKAAPVAILPMALYYGDGSRHTFRPNLYIDAPLEAPFESPRQITRGLAAAMTDSLAHAVSPSSDSAGSS